MAKDKKDISAKAEPEVVAVEAAKPAKVFKASETVNKARLRSEFEWRLAAGLTAIQALDTALNQIEKDEADAATK